MRKNKSASPKETLTYAKISLVAFFAGVPLLLLFVFKADDLGTQGLIDKVYYILLIPFSLASAAFLFKVMQSSATFKGKILGGALRLGGPAVVFFLVVTLGFYLVPDTDSFNYKIYLRDKGGKSVLKSGQLKMKLENDERIRNIDSYGDVIFSGIPPKFKKSRVKITLVIESGWQFAESHGIVTFLTLDKNNATIHLERDDSFSEISGSVIDEEGNIIVDATVIVVGVKVIVNGIEKKLIAVTKSDGSFSIEIPKNKQKPEQFLRVVKTGYKIWEEYVYPGGKDNEVEVVLQRATRE